MSASSRVFLTPLALWEQARRAVSRLADLLALLSVRFAPGAKGFVLRPEPRSTGQAARGRQMLAGTYLAEGEVIEHLGSPWDIAAPELIEDLHGFAWLDDLIAVDSPQARDAAQRWVFDWINRYSRGRGPGWTPEITGRRVVRWVHHAILLLNNRPSEDSRAYFNCLGQQARYLQQRWRSAPVGLPRFEALTGLVYAGLALEGLGATLPQALAALGRECAREIGPDGALRDRNAEALAEVFTLLAWVNAAVSSSGGDMDVHVLRALDRMAPAIRSLRLGNGQLVRFNGSGGGQADRIDQALSDAGIRAQSHSHGAMGYARIAAGTTLVVMDTGALPPVDVSDTAQAGTLSFEMSSGRLPLLVNMGTMRHMGPAVRRRARATASHNALVLQRRSSARFIGDGLVGRTFGQRLVAGPRKVTATRDSNEHGIAVRARHDGYRDVFGLTHERQIALLHSGREVQGSERIFCETPTDQERLVAYLTRASRDRVGGRIYFHAHPDVTLSLDMGGRAASLRLPGGEVWILRATGGTLTLTDGLYLETGRLQPRATRGVVVSFAQEGYETLVTWTLARAD